jgi:septum formation inhibitor MinC
LEDDHEDTANENSDVEEDKDKSNKRSKKESMADVEDVEKNNEERKYVKMKVRSGDTISSPCWSSKLCQIATLTKEGTELMKKKRCK